MPYPDDFSAASFDRTMRSNPEVARRAPNADELDIKRRVQAVMDAIAHLRAGPQIFDFNSLGDDALQGVLADSIVYCCEINDAIDAIPEEEAQAEEVRILEEWQ